jgi:bla regulator protein BlaR1
MNPFDLFVCRFLLASGGCLAAGLGVWALTSLLRRVPGFQLQRSAWLLSQLTIVAVFLVIVLPHSERLRLVPPIELDGPALVQASVAPAPAAASVAPAPPASVPDVAWLTVGARGWLIVYLLGLAWAIAALARARRLLHGLAVAGSALERHPGFIAQDSMPALEVIEVDSPISPMLFGLFRPRLLLPRHLRSFDAIQQQMIVEHELTHLRRRDLHWMSAGLLLQTVLWFNPFMRLLRDQLSWAQELGCDRDVLAGRPRGQRKAYAAALVAQLKTQHRALNAALAFGGVSPRTVAERIALIREPALAHGRRWLRLAAFAGPALVLVVSVAFQPALALPTEVKLSCTVLADAASGQRLVREGRCGERVTPASTFNIAVSLMGYDSAILHDAHTPAWPFKPGYADWNPSWRASTDPTSWIGNSVVWYAQQVTARLGAQRFGQYVEQFKYGNQDVSGDPGKDNGLALSWINSSLAISPDEQVDFLGKIVKRELPVSAAAYDMTARLTLVGTLANGWEIHGKTGTANPVLPDGKDDNAHQYGWFVGWAKKGSRTLVFARLELDESKQGSFAGLRVKQDFLRDLPERLDAL